MLMSSGSSYTLLAWHVPAHTFIRNSPNSTASHSGSPSSSHLRISLQHRALLGVAHQAVCVCVHHRDLCCFQLRKATEKKAATAGTELCGLLSPAHNFDLHACMHTSRHFTVQPGDCVL